MTIFVDASAIISIVALEEDAEALVARLITDPRRCTSPLAAWEAVAGLCHSRKLAPFVARAQLKGFLQATEINLIPLGEPEFTAAADAYARFGKGRHPAGLNMGDCFAYACARTHDAKLLFKGDDFGLTDIVAA